MQSAALEQHSSAPSGEFRFQKSDFDEIAAILHKETGIFLQESKMSMVYSRLAKRLRKLGIPSFSEYCAFVTSGDGVSERADMISALTTNVTRFFREPHHFEKLQSDVLPPLIDEAKKGGRVRIWSSGCSNGSEPYSIAFTLLSMMPDAASYDIKILATDIDDKILADAKSGVYSDKFTAETPEKLAGKFLQRDAGGNYVVADAARALVSFRQLNIIGKWPMKGKFDIIFCRNVVIYFQEDTQQEIWQRYSSILKPKGWLFIGHSERVSGPATDDFGFEGLTIYRKQN